MRRKKIGEWGIFIFSAGICVFMTGLASQGAFEASVEMQGAGVLESESSAGAEIEIGMETETETGTETEAGAGTETGTRPKQKLGQNRGRGWDRNGD